MQEKINSYDQCFVLISEVLGLLNQEVQEAIAIKIIDYFIEYLELFFKQDSSKISRSKRNSSFFEQNIK
jgi:hypothetical protein